MLNFENALISPEGEKEIKAEPVKSILDSTDAILTELGNVLRQIEEAIYSPRTDGTAENMPHDECLLDTLNRQRNTAKELLKTAMHIKEGLW